MGAETPEKKAYNEAIKGWLGEKWSLAEECRDEGHPLIPNWFYHNPTDAQLRRLDYLGVAVDGLTKGMASDIMGLVEPMDDEHRAILKFFGVPLKGVGKSEAAYRIGLILSEPENQERFDNRPATVMQKDMFRFFGRKPPSGVTNRHAKLLEDELYELIDEHDDADLAARMDRWDAYCEAFEELCDAEVRNDYGIKKPSLSLYREAYAVLVESNKIEADGGFDFVEIVKALIQIKPEIEKKL